MALRDKVLEILEENRGKSVSGNKIAVSLGMTRSAVWKAVKQLREEGYTISAVTNRGYCLTSDNDILSEPSILSHLTTRELGRKMDIFKSIDSTNNFAKSLAQLGAVNGHCIIAEQQTDGKGRQGKKFHSPNNQGVYISVIIRPHLSVDYALTITSCAAVAVAEAIEKVSGLKCGIKWVNDIYANGKKLCGILTEAAINIEQGGLDYAVIGIGINVGNTVFPKELESIATSIKAETGSSVSHSLLIAEILNNLEKRLDGIISHDFIGEYRERSILTGKTIVITQGDISRTVKCTGFDDFGKLLIINENGDEEKISGGTVRFPEEQAL
ncbi:MAG: biotin--[acetyl-CoA-carboxylase] ligase [Oscillospiraceae bacterium]|nr:biotin--[acetyl-CoA-carboxylase] ligase [Oscillospiraceae bacterium]